MKLNAHHVEVIDNFVAEISYLDINLYYQKMIILSQQDDDEEVESFMYTEKRISLTKRSKCQKTLPSLSKIQTIIIIFLFVIFAFCFFQVFQAHRLKEELEIDRQIENEILLFESSHLQKQKVTEKEIYKFERMLAHYIIPFTNTNCILKRFGSSKDGGYIMCANLIQRQSTLFNFGIQEEDSFGCELSKLHTISNHQFDCTQDNSVSCTNAQFHKICLKDQNIVIKGKQYNQYNFIQNSFSFRNKSLIVKIDIEGDEWPALNQISIDHLEKIDQLIIQFHLVNQKIQWSFLKTIKKLLLKFIPVNVHMNNFGCFGIYKDHHFLGSRSFEVTLLNRRLVKMMSYKRSFSKSNENKPNEPLYVDCQMK